jgi:hypothetical protein
MKRRCLVRMAGLATLVFLFSLVAVAQTSEHPITVGGFVGTIDLRASVDEKPLGFGGRLTYDFNDNFALDGEAAYFPQNPSGNFGQTVALAGLKAGYRSEKVGVFGKVRPGVVHFGGDFFKTYNGQSQSHFAVDVGGVLEFYPSQRVVVRVDLGDTIIPFGQDTIRGPLPPFITRPGTTHNFQASVGVGFRF